MIKDHCGHECVCFMRTGREEPIPTEPCTAEHCERDTRREPESLKFWNMRPEEREELSKCLLDIQLKLPWKEALEKSESINEIIKHIYEILDMVKYNQIQCCAKCSQQVMSLVEFRNNLLKIRYDDCPDGREMNDSVCQSYYSDPDGVADPCFLCKFDECKTWEDTGCECDAYCIMAANNARRRPVPDVLDKHTPDEVFDKLCWVDVVMHVMNYKDKEDISFCRGTSCNYCGKFSPSEIVK